MSKKKRTQVGSFPDYTRAGIGHAEARRIIRKAGKDPNREPELRRWLEKRTDTQTRRWLREEREQRAREKRDGAT
jgi:hypothetical protein